VDLETLRATLARDDLERGGRDACQAWVDRRNTPALSECRKHVGLMAADAGGIAIGR
jgi:hypothetical protein